MPGIQSSSYGKGVSYSTISPKLMQIRPPHSTQKALLLYGPTMAQKNQSQINSMTYNISKKR
uniref:Uncharacterized protein n=1 Tax=viral metagenome TaxID=1070528 RepID=A0A6C0B9S3_9ZZZZ